LLEMRLPIPLLVNHNKNFEPFSACPILDASWKNISSNHPVFDAFVPPRGYNEAPCTSMCALPICVLGSTFSLSTTSPKSRRNTCKRILNHLCCQGKANFQPIGRCVWLILYFNLRSWQDLSVANLLSLPRFWCFAESCTMRLNLIH